MIKKYKILVSAILASQYLVPSVTHAATSDLSQFSSSSNIVQGNASESNALSSQFTINRTLNSIYDLRGIIQKQGINAVVQSVSSTNKSNVKVISTGSLADFLNNATSQLGYKWNYSESNNTVTFIALNPVLATPSVAKSTTQQTNQTQNKVITVAPTPASQTATKVTKIEKPGAVSESAVVLLDKVQLVNSNNRVWAMSPQDKTVKNALEKWAKTAGWQLEWRSKYDMPIVASLEISGDFKDAINEICRASQSTGKQLYAEMHNKNKVLVIYTPNEQIR